VIDALRAESVDCATRNDTVPLPLPEEVPVNVIHDTVLEALQLQPGAAVTVTVPVPPAPGIECARGSTSNEQPGDCLTVNVRPAMTSVPVLAGPSVGATRIRTGPGPLPDAPSVTVIHGALDSAVQGQPGDVATLTVVSAPDADTACSTGEMAYEHPSDWVTLNC